LRKADGGYGRSDEGNNAMKKRQKAIRLGKPTNAHDSVELRRWCIEQALRWPTYTTGYLSNQAFGGIGGGGGYSYQDADVIGRAAKICNAC
jgi:hypothetical protein